VQRLPEIAFDYVGCVRVKVAANQAVAKPNHWLSSAGSKLPQEHNANRKGYFFDSIDPTATSALRDFCSANSLAAGAGEQDCRSEDS